MADDAARFFLCHLLHDDAGGIWRPGRNRANQPNCQVLSRRHSASAIRNNRASAGNSIRPNYEWFDSAIFGWVSDHIGRENTMFIAFSLGALAVFGLLHLIRHPVHFIILTGLTFFAWGEIFSLFPSIVGDLFGRQW